MKRNNLIRIFLLVIALSFILEGCRPISPKYSGELNPYPSANAEPMVLRWNLSSDPETLDPGLITTSIGGYVINNTFEGLMRDYGKGEYEPAVAESYDVSNNGTVYTFKLRDAKWSDGVPITAHDFEYAWKRVLDPNLLPEPSKYAYQMFIIKGAEDYFNGVGPVDEVGVRALDDSTLQVTLVSPAPYFLELTAFYTFMPVRKDIIAKDPENWAKNPDLAVSNGPFKLSGYIPGVKLILDKNSQYWQHGYVQFDTIEALMILEESTALAAFEAGQIDMLHNVPHQEIPRLRKESPEFSIRPKVGTYYYNFNVQKPPFDDVRVRKALSLAIDRRAITDMIAQAGEIPATGFIPPGLKDSTGRDFRATNGSFGIDPNAADVESARKLLADAGFTEGWDFPEFELLYNISEGHRAIAEAIQEMWRVNLGIHCRLKSQEFNTFQEARKHGQYEVSRGGWIGDYKDPLTMLNLFISDSPLNDPQWRSKPFDELIGKSMKTEGIARDQALYDAEKLMMEEAIVLPIYHYVDKLMVKDYIRNVHMVGMGYWWFGFGYIQK